jgi:toxin ParE1/3/4
MTTPGLNWTPNALRRLAGIRAFIAAENPVAALTVLARIERAAKNLVQFPNMGRRGRVPGTREFVLGDVPYILVYRIQREGVAILTIIHTAQDWPERL